MSEASIIVEAAKKSARAAGLKYVLDHRPGYSRKAADGAVLYLDETGQEIKDEATLQRIKRLSIPPAWIEVWIAPSASAHLQATGRDARGRKQYRYHQEFRAVRDEHKFHRMMDFARMLPKIRAQVDHDLEASDNKRKVVAGVVKLLETTLIRVGNDEYAQTNKSYGLTTMLNRHATIRGTEISFSFKGKSGVRHSIAIRDQRLAKLVKRCQDLPGQELFAWKDENGMIHDVGSGDVNNYLHEIAGEEFTAKDFRTWAGTVLAALALRESEAFATTREAKKNIGTAIEAVSKMLGNTPTICRKCYIHPVVLDSYLEGQTIATMEQNATSVLQKVHDLRPEEAAVVALLQQRLKSTDISSGAVKVSSLSPTLSPVGSDRTGAKKRKPA